jgi:adenine-specific DNA-methyltransferase
MFEKMKMKSADIVSENMAYIAQRWPECLTEAKDENGKLRQVIDFDRLRQVLSSDATGEGQERYQFTWPDKRHAIRLANTPTTDTLRPCREDSVDFDNTQNLYIEGDNLDVLKLLRESYLGKVKMIYIDPPYNTGGDFVYKDNFIKRNSDYAEVSGAYDEEGNQIVQDPEKNLESNGRFHTDWLNMIYPRLKVARDLLTEDGVIFISIDDQELNNLTKVCSEIFGERNFVSQINWISKSGGAADERYIIDATEYILVYAKDKSSLSLGKEPIDLSDEKYKLSDKYEKTRGKYLLKKLDFRMTSSHYTESLNFPVTDPDGSPLWPGGEDYRQNGGWNWRWSKEKMKWGFENDFLEFKKNGKGWTLNSKQYMLVDNKGNLVDRRIAYRNYILNDETNTTQGSRLIADMFGSKVFEYAKPLNLLTKIFAIANIQDGDILLDFFSGSSSSVHALFQLNAVDHQKRKFIMVQLPEKTNTDSEAFRAGFKDICSLAKERIRRAGKKIKEEHPDWKGDTGFRVLKLASSNMESVFYTPAETTELTLFSDNIKTDRTDEDLLFQVMMELGIALSEKIEKTLIAGKTVWNVNQGYLMACFEPNVTEDTIAAIAKQQPFYFVMADRSLASDNVADNFEQLFEEYSPDTQRRIL